VPARTPARVVALAFAALLPPLAAIVGNARPGDHRPASRFLGHGRRCIFLGRDRTHATMPTSADCRLLDWDLAMVRKRDLVV
jgi:hypothetical protein